MDKLIYTLCALTAIAGAVLLLRTYWRTRFRLLMWSGLCFAGLGINNVLLVIDRVMFTSLDLSTWRLLTALFAVLLLLYGLVMESSS